MTPHVGGTRVVTLRDREEEGGPRPWGRRGEFLFMGIQRGEMKSSVMDAVDGR